MKKFPLLLPVVLVFVASVCVMVAEIIAGRLVARYLGQSLYTWTSCIGVFLAGISVGNYTGGKLADRFDVRRLLPALFAAAAGLCLIVPLLNRAMAHWPLLWEQSWPTRIFVHITTTFIGPAMALGTIGPVAAKLALEHHTQSDSGRVLGIVYAWGAIGSVAGTYLCGFVLIAHFGTAATMMMTAGVLLAASVLLSVFVARRGAVLPVVLAAVALVIFAPSGSRARFMAVDRQPDEVFQGESKYAFISVRKIDGNPNMLSMMLDRLMHSEVNVAEPLDVKYGHNRVYAALTDTTFKRDESRRVFVLGGGGYGFPRYLEAACPRYDVDVAEFDPRVIEVAQSHFGLSPTSRIHSIVQDARQYMQATLRKGGGIYDAAFSDIVSDYEIPYHLLTREFLEEMSALLKPDGYYAFIVIDAQALGRLMSSVYLTAQAVFPHVSVTCCQENPEMRDMFILVCSKKEIEMPAVIQRIGGHPKFRGSVLSPETLSSIVQRSSALALTDDFVPAEYMASGLSRIDTDEPVEQYTRSGLSAIAEGRMDEGLEALYKAVQRKPNSAPILFNFAHALADVGQLDDAARFIQQAATAAPDDAHIGDFAAMLQIKRGDIQGAIAAWREVIRKSPDFVPARNNLGSALMMSGQPAEAIDVLRPAVAAQPANSLSRFSLANACLSAGRLDDAEENFKAAIAARPGFVEAVYSLGLVDLRRGNVDAAREKFRRALEINPQFAAAARQIEALSAAPQTK